jgi:ribosomal protein L29
MKVVELREKNIEELLVVADELKAKIHQEKMDLAMNKKANDGVIRNAKKDLARVKTVLKEKQAQA